MVTHSPSKCTKIAIPIYGVTCWGSDASLIDQALATISGVVSVYVNPAMEMAYLRYNPEKCGIAEFTKAIEKLGLCAGEASLRSIE
jgi:copper chaperone CopZ